MKIAIVTLPLHTNYGGILQAYALKSFLVAAGHEVDVLDPKVKMPLPKWWKAPFIYASRAFKSLLKGAAGPEVFRELRFRRELPYVGQNTLRFVSQNLKTRTLDAYKDIREGEYDAFVVGSDQVWRPRYFGKIDDAFLAFTKDWKVIRIAYAASFGTDQLEYSYEQLDRCSKLLESFNAVSIREDSGVKVCSEWFDCDRAVQVLDPVLLADPAIYKDILEKVEAHPAKGKMLTYILDSSREKDSVIDFIERVSGLSKADVSVRPYDKSKPIAERVVPSLEEWLAAFADAEFVVTDSFHGCVLSILMHKRFVAVGNSRRGLSRMSSLLEMFGLDQRLVHGIDPEDDGEFFLAEPDWSGVDRILGEQREKSGAFLTEALTKR
ncbi:MAG: polysaccharide pyruvyl transferase family protein [Bacteroidales bacterium]|nr:polysaccharide pyruvyl transferase family protein [Bacteroidales bacterium]